MQDVGINEDEFPFVEGKLHLPDPHAEPAFDDVGQLDGGVGVRLTYCSRGKGRNPGITAGHGEARI